MNLDCLSCTLYLMIFFLVSQELFDDVQHLRAHADTDDVVDDFMASLPESPAVVYDDNDDDLNCC